MTVLESTRLIAADPTSAALLLAGPSAVELWPGVELERSGPDDQIRVIVDLPPALLPASGRAAVLVRAVSPRRTPTSFVLRFSFGLAGFPAVKGEIALQYAVTVTDDSPGGRPATEAALCLEVADADGAETVIPREQFVAALRELAAAFLDNLADAAEGRSRAA